ncbi:unnamed protein product [Hymenolepis diminuta]|uniref:Uncharacterized protein n=1 Tax=Hymenolepis diminuta TaxID=6216 RepID=A0A564YDX0_HYMDI|nr:unnamed protein product [Hymenolepis diminuta]
MPCTFFRNFGVLSELAETHLGHTLNLHCPLIAFVPFLPLTRLNLHCGLNGTIWPSRLLVFRSVTWLLLFGISSQPLVVTSTPIRPRLNPWKA